MINDLGSLIPEIESAAKQRGLALFHGKSRLSSEYPFIEWDTERYPDYRDFLEAAAVCGVKLLCVHGHQFTIDELEFSAMGLKEIELPSAERRAMEKQLDGFRMYIGFTSAVELAFDFQDNTYFFHLRAPWRIEYVKLAHAIDGHLVDDEDDDEDAPMSGGTGYFSRN